MFSASGRGLMGESAEADGGSGGVTQSLIAVHLSKSNLRRPNNTWVNCGSYSLERMRGVMELINQEDTETGNGCCGCLAICGPRWGYVR